MLMYYPPNPSVVTRMPDQPSCSRCQGLIVVCSDICEGEDVKYAQCLNCGHRRYYGIRCTEETCHHDREDPEERKRRVNKWTPAYKKPVKKRRTA